MSVAGPDAPDHERLAALLLDAEQRAGSIPALHERIAELEREVRRERERCEDLRREAQTSRERLVAAERRLVEVMRSPSWRLTKGLRAATRLTR